MSVDLDLSTAERPAESRPPTVLQVVPALQAGGVERGTIEIAAGLARAGWTPLVASSGGHMTRELSRLGVGHFQLPLDRKSPFAIRRNAGYLADIIRRYQVDIVHARSRAPAWSALMAARRTGARLVTTFHNAYGDNPVKHWYNAVMAKGAAVIAISDFVADHVRSNYKVADERLVTIHRGVDLELFSPERVSQERQIQLINAWRLPESAPVIMLPGRLTRWKGQAVLIEALAQLGRDDIACVLVGSDQGRIAYRRELEALAARRGVDDLVRIVDHCRDMPAAYMLADVVVSASTMPEGFGRVAAEAQAMGRPVIATDHGGARETVLPGDTGWLVPPGDSTALAKALREVLGLDPERRGQLAAMARRHIAENFTVEQMCERTLDVYAALLNGS